MPPRRPTVRSPDSAVSRSARSSQRKVQLRLAGIPSFYLPRNPYREYLSLPCLSDTQPATVSTMKQHNTPFKPVKLLVYGYTTLAPLTMIFQLPICWKLMGLDSNLGSVHYLGVHAGGKWKTVLVPRHGGALRLSHVHQPSPLLPSRNVHFLSRWESQVRNPRDLTIPSGSSTTKGDGRFHFWSSLYLLSSSFSLTSFFSLSFPPPPLVAVRVRFLGCSSGHLSAQRTLALLAHPRASVMPF